MNTFVNAVSNQEARTANGMKARQSSSNACVDLFYKIGASRGKNIVPDFIAAYVEDRELALRIAQWARDVRGGSGERQIFKDILDYLDQNDTDAATLLLKKIPTIGRWDDMFAFKTPEMKGAAFAMLDEALKAGNGLAAKWCPRKGELAMELRTFMGLSPKQYRRLIVDLTKVVETQMCAKDWDNINFSHVPSLASSRYKKAFHRHTPKFAEYVAALTRKDPTVKVNASAVYPYDILKGIFANSSGKVHQKSKTEIDHIVAQWDALPNFVGDSNVLPLIDTSSSMHFPVGGYNSGSSVLCVEVAVSLGLYLADKNTGKFKDTFLTFNSSPQLVTLRGNVVQKAEQMATSPWGGSTNLHAAFDKILHTATSNNVPQSEMPEILLICSDMQFNCCSNFDDSAIQMIERKYEAAGYTVPQVVFWNLNAASNVPVESHKSGAALVSGFSPAIVKSVLAADTGEFTPYGIMLKTVMSDRYAI